MNYEKITEALKILKAMCDECGSCDECPCAGEYGEKCLIANEDNVPKFWNITTPRTVTRCLLEE